MWLRCSLSLILALQLQLQDHISYGLECVPRDFGESSVVCVCNATYCDSLGPSLETEPGTVRIVETSEKGSRFHTVTLSVNDIRLHQGVTDDTVQVLVNRSQEYQAIIGFGGAFTDAAGINFVSLPDAMRFDIVNAYYSQNGSEYNMGRIPMASCDFSTHPYSYDDHEGDLALDNFQLAPEDFQYKIPFLLKAQSVSTQPLLLFGSPWSSPGWMKTNGKMENGGVLKGDPGGEYYQTWANYFVKFLEAYEANNVTLWGLTAENEPGAGFLPDYLWQCLGFTAETQQTFIAQNLGPALKAAGFGLDKVKLMTLDDQRLFLPGWPRKVFANKTASDFVSGVAFHWYMNEFVPASLLDITHNDFPDKFLLATEACNGDKAAQDRKVILGDWDRAQAYAHDIIQDLLHWTSGWVDWNLALDLQGGPNWVKNFVDAPIIVNASSGEFFKQPMYYALAHFSKFLKSGSKRVDTSAPAKATGVEVVAFKRDDDTIAFIALNKNSNPVTMDIQESETPFNIQYNLPGRSIQTYTWK